MCSCPSPLFCCLHSRFSSCLFSKCFYHSVLYPILFLSLFLSLSFSLSLSLSLSLSISLSLSVSLSLSIRCGKHVVTHVMNPKSMHRERLLGHMDIDTREWTDGVLTDAARKVVREPPETSCWIICDGDVDPEVRTLQYEYRD